jgi:hypothetical protein
LLHRLPTKVNLAKQGVVGGVESHCVLCPMELEKESHLFGGCAFASTLWSKVFNWIGWNGLVPRDPIHIFGKFNIERGKVNALRVLWRYGTRSYVQFGKQEMA